MKPDASNPEIIENPLCLLVFKRLEPFRVHVRVAFDFGPNVAPFWHQFWSKINQNTDPKRH
jgi:hypothetical protein